MFTARYELSPYIKQIIFVLKGLMTCLAEKALMPPYNPKIISSINIFFKKLILFIDLQILNIKELSLALTDLEI